MARSYYKRGKVCDPGCDCHRHNTRTGKSPRDDISKGRCVAPNDNLTALCGRGVRDISRQLCSMHYARWQRHGSTERLHGGRWRDPSQYEKNLKQRRELRKKQLAKDMASHCMCGCMMGQHHFRVEGYVNRCLTPECNCKKFDRVEESLYQTKTQKIERLGFTDHINDEARCLACDERVNIGTWFDEFSVRRAALHRAQGCSSLRSKKMA